MPKLKVVVPVTAPNELKLDSGVITTGLTMTEIQALVVNGVLEPPRENVLGLSSGGLSITCTPTIVDLGEDIDGVQPATAQFQYITGYETSVSGTMVTAGAEQIRLMLGNATSTDDGEGLTAITPQQGFVPIDMFKTIHIMGKQGNNAIWICEVANAMNTGGFSQQTTDKNKSTFSVEFKGHYDIADMEKCPMTFYILEDVVEPPVGG